VAETSWQDVFPILSPSGKLVGTVTAESLRIVAAERELEQMMVAADAMHPPVTVAVGEDLRAAVEAMVTHSLREVPVLDAAGRIVGLLDESDIHKAYLLATTRSDQTPLSASG
jgi:CIC family chloride channel protein